MLGAVTTRTRKSPHIALLTTALLTVHAILGAAIRHPSSDAPRHHLLAGAGAAVTSSNQPGLHPAFQDASALKDLIHRLPKAELHLHIEGTLEPELMFQLAAKNNIKLPYPDVEAARAARSNFTCLQDFLDIYVASMKVLVTEDDFYSLATQYLARAHEDNIKVAEISFDPQGHIARGVSMDTIVNGLARAMQESPVYATLVLCIQRESKAISPPDVLRQALPHLHTTINAVGLDGSELQHPPWMFEDVFEAATKLRLRKTAHAGEEGGPGYVFEALKLLGAERIDHGIRSLEDPALVAFMADAAIPITLCPISNLRLQVYKGQLEERIRQMLGSGIRVTINSDDPAYFGSYLEGNFEWVAMIAGLGPDDLATLAANSFEASFIPEELKARYVAAVWAALDEWRHDHASQL